MSRSVLEKAVCEECGVDVRENTLFCYNCGSRITETTADRSTDEGGLSSDDESSAPIRKPENLLEPSLGEQFKPEAKAALDDLAERIRIEPSAKEDSSVALATAKRKKARGAKRKGREYVWEPIDDPPPRRMLLIVVMITFVAILAVFMTVVWK